MQKAAPYYFKNDPKEERRSYAVSIMVHLVIFLIWMFPILTYPDPPPEIQGVLVDFGVVDDAAELPSTESTPNSDATEKSVESPLSNSSPNKSSSQESAELVQKKELIQKESQLKAAERERKRIEKEKKEEEDRQKAQQQRAEEMGKREEERQKKLEQARKEQERQQREEAYQKSKEEFSDIFGASGQNGQSNQDPGSRHGDPNASALEGLSTGSGTVGEGLSDRGVAFEPVIRENSQKTGKVIVRICVNQNGKVVEAKFTQKGSTTTDKQLVEVAEKNALKYRFTASEIEKQCGYISIDFKLK